MKEFESALMSELQSADHPDAKALKRWFDRNPKGRLRQKALKRMEEQTNGNVKAIDWGKLGVFIRMLLELLKLLA